MASNISPEPPRGPDAPGCPVSTVSFIFFSATSRRGKCPRRIRTLGSYRQERGMADAAGTPPAGPIGPLETSRAGSRRGDAGRGVSGRRVKGRLGVLPRLAAGRAAGVAAGENAGAVPDGAGAVAGGRG